jgi:hypothetical protein
MPGNNTAVGGIYLKQARYGNISRTFIEETTSYGIKFQDVVNVDIIQNNVYGPGAAAAGTYGLHLVHVAANNTSVRLSNNYTSGWFTDLKVDDYGCVGMSSASDIYEVATTAIKIGTNCRNIVFIGPNFETFTTAIDLSSGNVSIINAEGINYSDITYTGLPGGDGNRSDLFISVATKTAGGNPYDPDGNGSCHRIGHIKSDGRGIVTHDYQSRAKMYVFTEQVIPNGAPTRVNFDDIIYCSQNEVSVNSKTGTATATTAGKLVDAAAHFLPVAWATGTAYVKNDFITGPNGNTYLCWANHTSGTWNTDLFNQKWRPFTYVGARVCNTADKTYTYVTAVDSDTTLSINNDIFTAVKHIGFIEVSSRQSRRILSSQCCCSMENGIKHPFNYCYL